jgi:hypothetical protein
VFPVHFAACTERSLEQIKSGLWPTHLFRQITGVVTAYSYDGTKSSAIAMIHRFCGEFNGVDRPMMGSLNLIAEIPGFASTPHWSEFEEMYSASTMLNGFPWTILVKNRIVAF